MDTELSSCFNKSTLLTITNEALSSALSKAMRFVSHPSGPTRPPTTPSKYDFHSTTDKDHLPVISLDEVHWHDNSNDCWIVVYDRVFDITAFLQEHPGGEEVLMEHAGRDATMAFRGTGHSREALKSLEKYLIGILPDDEQIYTGGRKVLEMLSTSLTIAS